MDDFLRHLNGGELIGICFFLFLAIIVTISVIGGYWKSARESDHQARLAEAELTLKQDMINRGMSAEEIDKVLKASSKGTRNNGSVRS